MKILASDQSQDKLRIVRDVGERMVDLLYKNSISQVELYNYKIYEPIDRIGVIDIYIDGDWKHDHLRADFLIKENFEIIKNTSVELEDTGSDWGPELHSYYIYIPNYEEA